MGDVQEPKPVMLLLAVFSRHEDALDWARDWAIRNWGPLALESPRFPFEETAYYEQDMGSGLMKTFLVFERLVDPACLAAAKLASNQAERTFAASSGHPEQRPLNLDPGYLNESKLVLASTKDHAHRIYLDQGIFAEITLRFHRKDWQPWEWTYPDYRRPDFQAFFSTARDRFRELKMQSLASKPDGPPGPGRMSGSRPVSGSDRSASATLGDWTARRQVFSSPWYRA